MKRFWIAVLAWFALELCVVNLVLGGQADIINQTVFINAIDGIQKILFNGMAGFCILLYFMYFPFYQPEIQVRSQKNTFRILMKKGIYITGIYTFIMHLSPILYGLARGYSIQLEKFFVLKKSCIFFLFFLACYFVYVQLVMRFENPIVAILVLEAVSLIGLFFYTMYMFFFDKEVVVNQTLLVFVLFMINGLFIAGIRRRLLQKEYL